MVTDHRSAIRCRHCGPHGSWRLYWPTSRFDGEYVFLCRACADFIRPLLRAIRTEEPFVNLSCAST